MNTFIRFFQIKVNSNLKLFIPSRYFKIGQSFEICFFEISDKVDNIFRHCNDIKYWHKNSLDRSVSYRKVFTFFNNNITSLSENIWCIADTFWSKKTSKKLTFKHEHGISLDEYRNKQTSLRTGSSAKLVSLRHYVTGHGTRGVIKHGK